MFKTSAEIKFMNKQQNTRGKITANGNILLEIIINRVVKIFTITEITGYNIFSEWTNYYA